MSEPRRSGRPSYPVDWSATRLSDIFERVAGGNDERNRNVLTISAQHGLVGQAEFFNRVVASEDVRGYTLLREGDFAYNKSYSAGYPFGVIRRLDRYSKGVVSPLYLCFRLRSRQCDSDFMAYLLGSGVLDEGLTSVAQEGARNHGLLNVSVGGFFGLEVSLPSCPEQRRIASILHDVDEVICKSEAIIAKLRHIRQGLLHDLLTRGAVESGELRPSPREAPHLYAESPIGLLPREWRALPLHAFADMQVGYAFKSEWFTDRGGARLLRGDNVGYGVPDWTALQLLPWERVPMFDEYQLNVGDVVVGMDRTFTKTGVKVSVVGRDDVPCLLVQRVGRFQPKGCSRDYLRWLLAWPRYHRALMAQQKGMDIPHLSKSEILSPVLPLPRADEQARIAAALDSIEANESCEIRELAKLRQLQRGITHDLLTGRVRAQVAVKA